MSTNFWEVHPEAPKEQATIANTVAPQQEAVSPIPEIVPQAQPDTESDDPLSTFRSDPMESMGPAEMLTRGKINAATAQNSIIRAALSKAKPTGKYVPTPSGGMTWVPDPTPTAPVVGNVAQLTPGEMKQASDIERRNAGVDRTGIAADLADQQWRANAELQLSAKLGQGNGKAANNLSTSYTSLLGMEMDKVRGELVKEGYGRDIARQIAYDSVVKAFQTNYRINPQGFNWLDQHVSPINDRVVFGGGDAGGTPMTPEEIAKQKEDDKDPEDRNRGWWSGLWNGGAAESTPADVISNPAFRNVLNESVGKLPNQFTKKKEYDTAGEAWAHENTGIDAAGIAGYIGSTEEKVKAKLNELMFLEDIRRNGVARGYAKKLPDGSIIKANITQEDIDSVITPQIERLKKALTSVR